MCHTASDPSRFGVGTNPAFDCDMIKHIGRKWVLYDSKGKRVLGTHPTKAAAMKQERAINISKARKAGHAIPPP